MSQDFYLPRTLASNERTFTERELMSASAYVVVLSEPGGGKSSLLKSLAEQLKVECVTANLFSHMGVETKNGSLVIDAFDELAKIDQVGINRLLAFAKKSDPTHVIISSRSSEWGASSTKAFEDAFRCTPLVVRLEEFNEAEQQAIFSHHVINEDFEAFRGELSKFDLEPLLPNPQFLKLFADAYIESGRRFKDKSSIFSMAVERLAREVNTSVASKHNSFPVADKVALASEIFAKLLLSGADGVTTSEASETRIFPMLNSVQSKNNSNIDILATKLFRLGDHPDLHRPVHKVVAEYCAACYLVRRIGDPLDTLTLPKCYSVIAPNAIVRDELRGLIGWMAALGNKDIQSAIVQLDPYAVLANGDPSRLYSSTKRVLIQKLRDIEMRDPYFRRGDYGRSFSMAGFFSKDVIDEIRPILTAGEDGHLRDLILELLVSSKEASLLEAELQDILLSAEESQNSRLLASKCLLSIQSLDHEANLATLIAEASHNSLRAASDIITSRYIAPYNHAITLDFLRGCARLYPEGYEQYSQQTESRYFLKRFARDLNPEIVERLLDDLTFSLVCTCDKEPYECSCRTGISKIVGLLLDNYFGDVPPPYSPAQVWQWVNNLNYYYQKSSQQSAAVKAMRENVELRQGLLALVFTPLADREKIINTKIHKFDFHSHSGLGLFQEDTQYLADLAFETGNPVLWATCIPLHHKHRTANERGPDLLRQRLRRQALAKPAFMRAWATFARAASRLKDMHELPRNLKNRIARSRRRQALIREQNILYVRENRELIESGAHWACLMRIAELSLMHPDKINEEFGDEGIARTALKNCLGFIAPSVPGLRELAELSCSSKFSRTVQILHAACITIMADENSLQEVDPSLLRSLRACINIHYSAVGENAKTALKQEIDRIIFAEAGASEAFLREFIEPKLDTPSCVNPDVWLLDNDDAFCELKSKLSIEWLTRFGNLNLDTLDVLFEIAAEHGDRSALETVIRERTFDLENQLTETPNATFTITSCKFWFVRALYFIEGISHSQWHWLQEDPDLILYLFDRSTLYRRQGHGWPSLTALKTKMLLDAFVEQWPSVDLPDHWGSDSPKNENAYRHIRNLVWSFNSFDPEDATGPLAELIADPRCIDLRKDLGSIYSSQLRKRSLQNYEAPNSKQISELLDFDSVITVEGLRQCIVDELHDFQEAIDGGEFNSGARFFDNGKHLNENRCTSIVAERLSLKLVSRDITITPEHHLKDDKRSDFTAARLINGVRRLVVTEVKGQWHPELYTAAKCQLHERYSIHPDAERQGIFLVLWFGTEVTVAGLKTSGIKSAEELRQSLETSLPDDLHGLIDIVVLDLSKSR
jgi:cytidylate kinase